MTLGERMVGDVVVLDLTDEMIRDNEGYGAVKKRVRELLDQGQRSVLLNLSGVTYMDSANVGEIASSFITARSRLGRLKVAAAVSPVTTLLTISKLDTVIEVFDTEAEALLSFARSSPLEHDGPQ